jgi:predicted nucleotidyltransferase
MENIVQWAKGLKKELGNNLVSVILYGSAVRGEYVRARSDLNLMLVFKKLDLEHITKVGKMMRRKVRKQTPQLVFWTEAEIDNAWDVFPLEFEDIKTNHQCLVGKDLFRKRTVNKKHMRYQIEFELRSKLLNVRDSWLSLRRDKYALEMFLVKAGNSFDYLIRKAEAVFGKKMAVPSSDVFETIKKVKNKEIRLKRGELQHLFHQLHETVESVIKKIDAA